MKNFDLLGFVLPFSVILLSIHLTTAQQVGFSNQHFRVVTHELAPFIFYDASAPENDRFYGLLVQLLRQILVIAGPNNSIEIYPVPDGLWGDVSDNGTITGCVAEAFYGRADIILGPLAESPSRLRAVDFGFPWYQTSLSILVLADQTASPAPFAFFDPFTPRLWVLIFCSGLICALYLWFINRYSPFGHRNQFSYKEESERRQFSLENVIYIVLRIHIAAGALMARSWSSRIFLLAFYFFAIIISISYLANLTAALSFLTPSYAVNSLQDIPRKQALFCVEAQSYPQAFFQSSPDFVVQAALPFLRTRQNLSDCMTALRNHEVEAVIAPDIPISYIASNLPCDTQIVGEPFGFGYLALPTAQMFPFRQQLSYLIGSLLETGTTDGYVKKWTSSSGCDDIRRRDQGENSGLSIDIPQLAGLWYILLIAAVCSIVLVGLEWWLWSKREILVLGPLRTFVGDRQRAKARRIHSKPKISSL